MKDSVAEWDLSRSLKSLVRPLWKYCKYTHTQTATHADPSLILSAQVQKVHVEKLIHTHTHTDEAKRAIYTWWVFDHQLSSISLSGSLVSEVLFSSASSINPHLSLTAKSTHCHFMCVCTLLQLIL